jgi:hypothetical protein
MTDAEIDPAEQAFQVHLIAMSGRSRTTKVRMLWVATTGTPAVYEGLVSWSKCIRWVERLRHRDISDGDWIRARRFLENYQYGNLRCVMASPEDLETLGLQRVDR